MEAAQQDFTISGLGAGWRFVRREEAPYVLQHNCVISKKDCRRDPSYVTLHMGTVSFRLLSA